MTISTIDLSGDLSKDIGEMVFKTYIDPRDLGIPLNARPTMTQEQRRLYTATATAGAGAVGTLINAISGRIKMLKRHLEIAQLKRIVAGKREKYSDSLYMKSLNIPIEYIEDFVYSIFEDKEAIRIIDTGNSLELLDYMMAKSPEYLELKKGEESLPIKKSNNE